MLKHILIYFFCIESSFVAEESLKAIKEKARMIICDINNVFKFFHNASIDENFEEILFSKFFVYDARENKIDISSIDQSTSKSIISLAGYFDKSKRFIEEQLESQIEQIAERVEAEKRKAQEFEATIPIDEQHSIDQILNDIQKQADYQASSNEQQDLTTDDKKSKDNQLNELNLLIYNLCLRKKGLEDAYKKISSFKKRLVEHEFCNPTVNINPMYLSNIHFFNFLNIQKFVNNFAIFKINNTPVTSQLSHVKKALNLIDRHYPLKKIDDDFYQSSSDSSTMTFQKSKLKIEHLTNADISDGLPDEGFSDAQNYYKDTSDMSLALRALFDDLVGGNKKNTEMGFARRNRTRKEKIRKFMKSKKFNLIKPHLFDYEYENAFNSNENLTKPNDLSLLEELTELYILNNPNAIDHLSSSNSSLEEVNDKNEPGDQYQRLNNQRYKHAASKDIMKQLKNLQMNYYNDLNSNVIASIRQYVQIISRVDLIKSADQQRVFLYLLDNFNFVAFFKFMANLHLLNMFSTLTFDFLNIRDNKSFSEIQISFQYIEDIIKDSIDEYLYPNNQKQKPVKDGFEIKVELCKRPYDSLVFFKKIQALLMIIDRPSYSRTELEDEMILLMTYFDSNKNKKIKY